MDLKQLRIILFLVFILFTSLLAQDYVPGKIYIKFQPGHEPKNRPDCLSGINQVDRHLLSAKVKSRTEDFGFIRKPDPAGLKRVFSFQVDKNTNLIDLCSKISACSGVEYAEPCFRRSLDEWGKYENITNPNIEAIPDDPFYYLQWHLPAVFAPSAWDVTTGDPAIIIAITDNGVDCDHPDLTDNIWNNPEEIPNNGIDDDENGFIDDFRGWDFYGDDNDPSLAGDILNSYSGHGTHVAGIASAKINNGYGTTGMAPACTIMPIKIGSGQFVNYSTEGITYAYENGAKVINCSWGSYQYTQLEADAITNATSAGALVIASAGNDSVQGLHYPSSLDEVISVTSVNQNDIRSSYSNYHSTVDVCAPGDDIFSTIISSTGDHSYSTMSGTSMSAPIVSGLAGLIFSQYPSWNPLQVTVKILNTCDNIYDFNPAYIGMLGSGRINAYRAVGEALPGLRFGDYSVEDSAGGDGDNIPEPGETIDLIISLNNSLQIAQAVSGILTTTHPQVSITDDSSFFGDIATGETGDNSGNPFVVQLGLMSEGEVALFSLDLVTSEGYSFLFNFNLIVAPPYANHNIGNVLCTVTNFSAIGYSSDPYYYGSELVGEGFCYPPSSGNALYHGTMMLSYGSSRVCASLYRQNVFPYEFEWLSDGPIIMSTPGNIADQESQSSYYDHNIFQPYTSTVVVNQKTYAWADTLNDDFIILEYEFSNVSTVDMNDCYSALFMDWDIGNYALNSVGYDAANGVGYMYSYSSNYYGIVPLSHTAYAARAVDNNVYTSYGPYVFTDNVISQFITGLIGSAVASGGEYSHLVSVGPFNLGPDTTVTVAFALVGGYNFNHLIANAISAKDIYQGLLSQTPDNTSLEPLFYLSSPTPNPFNLKVNFYIEVNAAQDIEITVHDILGRRVASIFQGRLSGGTRSFAWNADNLASGLYFLRVHSESQDIMKKLVLLK